MKTLDPSTLNSSSVAMHLGMCAAALASMAGTTGANAAVVTTFANTSVAIPATIDGVYLNFLNGVNGSSSGAVTGWDFNPYLPSTSLGSGISFYWNNVPAGTSGAVATAATGGTYVDLAAGSTVSSASTFSNATATSATATYQTVGSHVLGFRFLNETTGIVNYGYLTMAVNGTNGFPATITGWVYENTGAAITTPVPEASTGMMLSMGALALGAMNLRRLRRQRRQVAAH